MKDQIVLRSRRMGSNRYQRDRFELECKAGISVEYHHPDYVCMSRRRWKDYQNQWMEELQAIVEKNTDKEFGTDYDGLAEGVLAWLAEQRKKK